MYPHPAQQLKNEKQKAKWHNQKTQKFRRPEIGDVSAMSK
jgi:hypothetical protein